MKKKAPGKRLSATYVERIDVPGSDGDGRGGNGLKLITKERAAGGFSKSWQQRYRFDGLEKTKGLGSYPAVSLEQARQAAKLNMALVADGQDPKTYSSEIPIFKKASDKILARDAESRGEQYNAELRAMVKNHVPAHFCVRRLDKINSITARAVVQPIWATKHPTAASLLRHFQDVFDTAVEDGYLVKSPIGTNFRRTLGHYPRNNNHHPSLPYHEAPGVVEKIWSRTKPDIATQACLNSKMLNGMRSRSTRLAEWDEIKCKQIDSDEDWNTGGWLPVDWDNLEGSDNQIVWFVPEDHMKVKNGKTFRVPVSTGLLKVLKGMWEVRGQGKRDPKYIFASAEGGALSKNVVRAFCVRLNLPSDVPGKPATPHGFRSTIRDWAAEKEVPFEVAELMLAHELPPVVRAYVRTDLLSTRARVLQAWSDYVDGKLPSDWKLNDSDRKLFAKIEDLLVALRRAEERETRLLRRAEEAEERLAVTLARLTEAEARLAETEDERRRLEETTRRRQPMLPL